jgi:NTE family protein
VQTRADCPFGEWARPQRRSVRCGLGVAHVMASSALPFFFPAIEVEGDWYGDGGIRLTAPLSPAVHLGARRILAVSTRYAKNEEEAGRRQVIGYPPPAQVAGALYNAIFLDQLDSDALHMSQINELLTHVPGGVFNGLRHIDLLVLRPSEDLGRLANEYEPDLPRAFRFLTRGMGTRETRSNDMLSLMMFQKDYIARMIDMGEADASKRHSELYRFLSK